MSSVSVSEIAGVSGCMAPESAFVSDGDIEDFEVMHEESCEKGEEFYRDPASGYLVMTRVLHLKRGRCCGSGCRHCPYAHVNVLPDKDTVQKIQMPAMLHIPRSGLASEVTVLMWSGGKDSFLALRAMLQPQGRLHRVGTAGVVLLTTFDAASRMVAHQEVSAREIERQAKHLDVALVGVPLHGSSAVGYVSRLRAALKVVRDFGCTVSGLACGDLHLRDIRKWREEAVGGGLGLGVLYPLWSDCAGSNYLSLSEDLQASGVPCKVTAVTTEDAKRAGAQVGTVYGPALFAALNEAGVDGFGENGEFHTLAQVWEVPRERALAV
uniref:Diphthine--ammonia ligase n=1 Tax=Chromera velia CCMP2878 TaxID=1169474 RepID=A0A0G4IFE2_9ALVE|eukprot:Cvel_13863.t1-p1 / transcript=Cvel_13863.t1 / gene=Cvel_13863 / organism=Chromera_velia_CCMP2878 / gene_product=Uncharacterized protein C1orf53, putative / transcript_product=Uncharacterized protein C1orf53, putative / location=Cvel_scaffold964:3660-4628(+) / protein_length=323 / sequence_SO=supercontig / SO=protein_coding / is_pseudo=false